MNRNRKALRQDTWTGRFANAFYSIDKSKPNTTQKRNLSKKEIKLLQRDLNFIVGLIRKSENTLIHKFGEDQVPVLKVRIKNDEYPNMAALCSEGVVYINSGLIRLVFDKAFKSMFKNADVLSFSLLAKNHKKVNPDSSLFTFLNIMYNLKIKRVNLFASIDDDSAFDGMETYSSLLQTVSFLDNELIKVLSFFVSHEFYHLITKCDPSPEREVEADAYGILQYSRINATNITEVFFEQLVGRPLPEIFSDIYGDSTIHDANGYLPFAERARKIDSTLRSLRARQLKDD